MQPSEPKSDYDAMKAARPPASSLSSSAIGSQCVAALRLLQADYDRARNTLDRISDEARRLVKLAEVCEVPVPNDLRALAGNPLKSPRKTPVVGTWTCPKCGKQISPPAGRTIGKHRAECAIALRAAGSCS